MSYLTDKEKRLLFSALSREKKVCEEVDKECCREPYETPLKRVVESLEKKFYYDRFEEEIRNKAIVEYQKECAKFILNKRNEFVNEIQRRASNRMREAIVADTRTVSCYKTGIKEGLEEAVEVLDEIAEQMKGEIT